MTRKTKAEKIAERAAYNAALEAEQEAAYFPRLMNTLARASKLSDYELTVDVPSLDVINSAPVFVIRERNERNEYWLASTWSNENQSILEDLIDDIQRLENKIAETEKKARIRRAAIAKLTPEERVALNIIV